MDAGKVAFEPGWCAPYAIFIQYRAAAIAHNATPAKEATTHGQSTVVNITRNTSLTIPATKTKDNAEFFAWTGRDRYLWLAFLCRE
jgi:hypothetical protein